MPTDNQIAALKYLVAHSKDAGKIVKQLVWFLIDNSNNLTEAVSLSLIQDRHGFSREEIREIAHSAHDLTSSGGTTFLDQIFAAMGSKLHFSLHFGHYAGETFDTDGQFTGATTMRYTFWLAEKSYGGSGHGKKLRAFRKKLEAIDLNKPGLYPELENRVPPYETIS